MTTKHEAPGTNYRLIAIEQLQPSPTNPRKAFVAAELDELKASIAASGVQVPLLVRLIDDADSDSIGAGLYEIVAGERRYRAAQALGLAELPCLVRELTDEQARETQIVENLQRAGIHPLEEAEAFEELRARLGSSAAVAQAVAKEHSYVAKCLRLLELSEQSKQALLGGLVTIDHALLLARLAEREQNDALKWTLDRNAGSKTPVEKVVAARLERVAEEKKDPSKGGSGFHHYAGYEPESVKKLKARIENEGGIALSRAPWKLDDAALVAAAGPCSTCEKNTKANTPLFGDLGIAEQRCVDGACFGEKTQAFVLIAQMKAGQNLLADDKNVIPRLSWKASSVKPALSGDHMRDGLVRLADWSKETANPTRVLKQGQWVEAKKGSCPNVRSGVMADWSDAGQRGYMGRGEKLRKPGETLAVCIAAGCKAHRKAWEKSEGKSGGGEAAPKDEAARERLRQEQECVEKTETEIRAKVFAAILGGLNVAAILSVMAGELWDGDATREDVREKVPMAKGELLDALVLFSDRFEDEAVEANGYYLVTKKDGVAADRKNLWEMAKKARVDADAIVAKHFADAGSVAPGLERLLPKGMKLPKPAVEAKPAKAGAVKKAFAKKAIARVKAAAKARQKKKSG